MSVAKSFGGRFIPLYERLSDGIDLNDAIKTGLLLAVLWKIWDWVYNLYLHPSARYPGPLFCRMSILPNLYYAWKGTKHLKADELHRKYADVLGDIYGSRSQFEKGTFYSRGPKESQVLTRQREAAVRSYEETVLGKIRLFCHRISDSTAFGEEYKNMSRWFSYLTYDIMGNLTFGHDYGMLTRTDDHFIQPLIDTFQHSQVVLGVVPWVERWGLAPLLFVNILLAVRRFRKYVDNQVNHRIAEEKAGRGPEDIFKLLLSQTDKNTGERMEFKELSDEAVVLIIAASDTTGTALSGLSFYLARYPECYAKLKQEVRSTFSTVEEIVSGKKLLQCKYLRACVEEALRMSPGVPGYLVRESPKDATIDGHFIPANTQIGVPGWTMHRNPEFFPDPQVFKPERWLTESEAELQRLRSVHFPFSYGPRACIGKNLAYNTIYLVIARIAFLFEIESSEPLPLEFHVKDHFAAGEKNGPYLKFMQSR
ncbi:hypothetical protein EYZ11_003674 [Aspergillus tanneri]|uniref:Cytochrome P450 monooxygenase n=1 Tax=Aspergillus tanneri TaxID=1220188 RepID=A0A4S3JN41_9EURO|nr:hypothetical protein EYZ11_003674 [Aspergillus tanneri]